MNSKALYNYAQSAPVCSVEVMLVDLNTGRIVMLNGPNLSITYTNITFSVGHGGLTKTRVNISVNAVNTQGFEVSSTVVSELMN